MRLFVGWFRSKDLNAACVLVSPEPSRSVFHSQQAAEKAAMAFLTFHDVPFRKTHDLNELGRQCAALDPDIAPLFLDASVQRRLELPEPS